MQRTIIFVVNILDFVNLNTVIIGLKLRVRNRKIIFLFLNQNMLCVLKRTQWDGSFEHPKHMLKCIGKKSLKINAENACLSKPVLQ